MAGIKGPTLTIANGATDSNIWDLQDQAEAEDIDAISIHAPTTLPETVAVQCENDSGDGFDDMYSSGTKITIPAAGHITIKPILGERVMLKAGAAVAAERVFTTRYLRKKG